MCYYLTGHGKVCVCVSVRVFVIGADVVEGSTVVAKSRFLDYTSFD
jgi:hypothetical protein